MIYIFIHMKNNQTVAIERNYNNICVQILKRKKVKDIFLVLSEEISLYEIKFLSTFLNIHSILIKYQIWKYSVTYIKNSSMQKCIIHSTI